MEKQISELKELNENEIAEMIYERVNAYWWEFRAIWLTIPDNFEFSKIKGYRAYDGKDKDILELKEHYKLPPNKKEIQDQIRRNEIYEALK